MDYEEEQAQELEILSSIYTEDEFEQILPREYRIRVIPDTDKPDPPHFLLYTKLPPTYPEVVPEIAISLAPNSPRSTIPKDQYPELLAKLNEAAEENLGIAMIFTLASILKEMLEEILISAETKDKEAAQLAEEQERQRVQEELETEIRSIRRTPVTYELFLEWKAKFDAWKAEQKRQGNDVENVRGRNKEKEKRDESRLTGRQVFERMKAEANEGFEEGEEDGLNIDPQEDGEEQQTEEVTAKMANVEIS